MKKKILIIEDGLSIRMLPDNFLPQLVNSFLYQSWNQNLNLGINFIKLNFKHYET